MGRAERARALAAFRNGGARVLLMDAIGAVGLDLSFVQYVFLMEPLGDLALEQQIVSRAHRLGATRAVHAEVLVMEVRHPPPPPRWCDGAESCTPSVPRACSCCIALSV